MPASGTTIRFALADSPPDSQPSGTRVPLSPLHRVELAENLRPLISNPPEKDFPLHSIARKTGPDGRELVHSELVIAGKRARALFPLAARYPVHFVKSYHPWSFHGDPRVEFENSLAAARILGTPEPIGFESNSFRAMFLPGKPLSKISPFTGVDPPERCLDIAQRADPAVLIGLWQLAADVFEQVEKLHAQRFYHGDLELHNIIVCTSPIQSFLIDFESSERAFAGPEVTWAAYRARDLFELSRLAIYLQCGLGRQLGPLANRSLRHLPALFRNPSTFLARLDVADRRAVGS